VKVEQIVNVGSTNVTLDNLLTLANGINAIFAKDPTAAGVSYLAGGMRTKSRWRSKEKMSST
jgi:hypothetical protein